MCLNRFCDKWVFHENLRLRTQGGTLAFLMKKILSSYCHQRWLPSLFWPEITIANVKNRPKSKMTGPETNRCQIKISTKFLNLRAYYRVIAFKQPCHNFQLTSRTVIDWVGTIVMLSFQKFYANATHMHFCQKTSLFVW